MDPATQALLGSAAVLAVSPRRHIRWGFPLAAMAAAAPDLDIFAFIRNDAIGTMLLHRQFTHSLVFIPVGGVLTGSAFWLLARALKKPLPYLPAIGFATLAWATHGLLDACTSYGTFLMWPFNETRTSWDIISIIDLTFTLPLLMGSVLAAIHKSPLAARMGLALSLAYLMLGVSQHATAQKAQAELAAARGHTVEHGRTMPGFATLTRWRSVYRTADGTLHADEFEVLPIRGTRVTQGESTPAAPYAAIAPQGTRLNRDIMRYANFADTLLYHPQGNPNALADARYSRNPAGFIPQWGITFNREDPAQPATRQGL